MTERVHYAPEILAGLKGARFVIVGFQPADSVTLCELFDSVGAVAIPGSYEQCLPAYFDAGILALEHLRRHELKSALSIPHIVAGAAEDIAEGAVGAHAWSTDFVVFPPWCGAELITRAFRLLAACPSLAGPTRNLQQVSVVIADDDPEVATLLKTVLGNHMHCRIALNGRAALELVRQFPPNILILDVYMPSMNGFEVLEAVRREPGLKNLPIIMLTGENDLKMIERGKALGANDYVIKPFGANGILQRIRRVLLSQPVDGFGRADPGESNNPDL